MKFKIGITTIPGNGIRADGKIPRRATEGSAGFDLVSTQAFSLRPGEHVWAPTGICLEIPLGYYGMISARSSNWNYCLPTHLGIVDPDYRGQIFIGIANGNQKQFEIEQGQRIAQITFSETLPPGDYYFELRNTLDETERGDGGFGHTGK